MSKTFDLTPVFGPAVSVRHYSAASSSQRVARPAVRRSTTGRERGLLRLLSKLWAAGPATSTAAVYGLLVLAGIGALSYIFLINSAAAKGYEMKKIQNRILEQDDIRHSLEIKNSELSSLGAIDQAALAASLVTIQNEEFLTPTTVTALKTSK
jgi:hypothetical protein